MKRALFATAAIGLLALSATTTDATANVTNDEIVNDHKITSQVVTDGMGLQAQRHTPLNNINLGIHRRLILF